MKGCPHLTYEMGEDLPFMGGVAERTQDMNEAAHGGIRWRETCLLCGAARWVLHNNGHFEYGLWHKESS